MHIPNARHLIPAAVLSLLIGSPAFAQNSQVSFGAPTPPPAPPLSALSLNQACIEVSKTITPTVVGISVGLRKVDEMRLRHYEEYFRPFKGKKDNYIRRINGSGVLISADGYIVTNNHVVEDAEEDSILVKLPDQRSYWASIIGRDEITDLALLRIYGRNLPTAYFANSDSVAVGEWVLAVGNPLSLTSTVTAGIVSAKTRTNLEDEDNSSEGAREFIQTDAAINPGNSGGGLFDLQGRLLGINTSIYSYTGYFVGYGFAIPANVVKTITEDLADDGKVERGEIGIIGEDITEKSMRQLKLDSIAGLRITEIDTGSAAEAAGLRIDDVLLSVDDSLKITVQRFRDLLALRRPGETLHLVVSRDGKHFEKDLTLRKSRVRLGQATQRPAGAASLDLTVASLDGSSAGEFTGHGARVQKVDKYGAAAKAGIAENDILISVNGASVTGPEELAAALKSVTPGTSLSITYWRNGKSVTSETVATAARGKITVSNR